MSFFNDAQRDGLLTGRYICSECGGLMEFEDEWEDTLVSANAIGYDLETIMQMNVDKLKARYPDGFDAEHSLHRNQDDI